MKHARACTVIGFLDWMRATELGPVEPRVLEHLNACDECMQKALDIRMRARETATSTDAETFSEADLPIVRMDTLLWIDEAGCPCFNEPTGGPSEKFTLYRLIYRRKTIEVGPMRVCFDEEGFILVYEDDGQGGHVWHESHHGFDAWLKHYGFRYVPGY